MTIQLKKFENNSHTLVLASLGHLGKPLTESKSIKRNMYTVFINDDQLWSNLKIKKEIKSCSTINIPEHANPQDLVHLCNEPCQFLKCQESFLIWVMNHQQFSSSFESHVVLKPSTISPQSFWVHHMLLDLRFDCVNHALVL